MATNSAEVIRIEIEDHKNNLTALQTAIAPAWVSSQNIRSTSDILWSCIVTLTACIYTALHLNIKVETNRGQRIILKVKWVMLALIAPEVVICMAFSQYLEARWLVRELNESKSKKRSYGEDEDDTKFDMYYAFFVVMGGLRVSYEDIEEDGPWVDTPYASNYIRILSVEAVAALAREGVFIDIARKDIEDRSKADAIQKALVLLQVTWMVTQCIARKLYGLPLALLEVHTMIHVVCALILYICWFEKPLEVQTPEFLDLSKNDSLRNFLSLLLFEYDFPTMSEETKPKLLTPHQAPTDKHISIASLDEAFRSHSSIDIPDGYILPIVPLREEALPVQLQPAEVVSCGICFYQTRQLYRGEYLMLQRVVAAINEIRGPISADESFPLGLLIKSNDDFDPKEETASNPVFQEQRDMSTDGFVYFLRRDVSKALRVSSFTWLMRSLGLLFPLLYGGIHLTAWNYRFPSNPERLVWMISCFIIAGTYPFMELIYHVIAGFDKIATKSRGEEYSFNELDNVTFVLILTASSICALAARAYIVIEAFISLRNVPIGVYWSPGWVQMIPHV
ncbi:uncharacterized protein F4822DRAFT_425338 [Hypoxylon trugodes]|uniref:uncharacterized protein n=1 Tax=Hypoxylon trugodes TaxID=326681 RepID=UPI002191AD92|nr:uncharacterized protein F4822DRAFT_425338 [Hypoxylon trugodes]KAI1392122.1 hypothetical protein F4822DRAFT_425338 [Hypoxylon trugodes]